MHWMKSLKTPTPEVIERTLARLGRPGANAYFFDKLSNPAWVTPLSQRGFFKRPPPAIRSPDQGTIAFPDWPELRFLKRMAAQLPDVVGSITLAIPDTDNARVQQLQLEIGCSLNLHHSRTLAERAIGWLESPFMARLFGEPFAPFITNLIDLGDTEHAIRLARRFFASEERDGSRSRRQLDPWHYERYLNICLPTMRERAGLALLVLLRTLLLDATREPNSGQADDFSYIWRRDLERANHSAKQIPDILIDALCQTALELAQHPDVGFQVVRDRLLAGHRLILLRIVIFVASHVCRPGDSYVLDTLLDLRLLDRMTCRAEYAILLRTMFPQLQEPERQRVLKAMLSDPLQSIPAARRAQMSAEEIALWGSVVLRDRLSAFGDTLPSELMGRREQLIAELGEPPPSNASGVWSGPTSPKSVDSLGALSIPELIEYLANWLPPREFGTPSREGLARDLQQVVKNRAPEYSTHATAFMGLNPTYVRGLLLGLNDAATAKVPIDWPPVLALVRWVLDQPRGIAPDHNALEDGEDPDWSWTRQAISRLITSALTEPESGLDPELRDEIGFVLSQLLQDPDPLARSDPAEDKDPLTTSINSVRGTAAHALFRFAWWIHNHSPPQPDGVPLRFARMPEVRQGIERILRTPRRQCAAFWVTGSERSSSSIRLGPRAISM